MRETVVLKNGKRVLLRPVALSDAEGLFRYFRGLSPQSRAFFHPHPFEIEDARRIARDAANTDSVRVVAIAGDEVVGYAFIQKQNYTPRIPVLGIGIADAYQNAGLGRKMMDILTAASRARGHEGIDLNVYKNNERAIRLYSVLGFRIIGETSDHKQHSMRLRFSDLESPFKYRGIYLHPIPWSLNRLTADTWSPADWRWYLDLLHSAGANFLKIYVWPTQYFHPDYPETHPNEWRYRVLCGALAYARMLGLNTCVGFSNNTVPPFLWHRYPELRAEASGFRGITFCWHRGKMKLLPLQQHLIDTFLPVADSFMLWFAEPGLCQCYACTPYSRVIFDSMAAAQSHLEGRKPLYLSFWRFAQIEQGERGRPNPHLRARVLGVLKPGDMILADESDPDLFRMAADCRVEALRLAFFTDPEDGTERANVLPRPRLSRIEEAVRASQQAGHAGIAGYRLTPYTQFASDWTLMRKMLNPRHSAADCLADLARRLSPVQDIGIDLSEGLLALDNWWETRDSRQIQRSLKHFERLRRRGSGLLSGLADGVSVIYALAAAMRDGSSPEECTLKLQKAMSASPLFQAYTLDHLWAETRARAFLHQRTLWWLDYLKSGEK
ncbi:MAG: GNAT family N-acetyltransferase [Armatimonadetes bacterium]|nr:GNAT family N-acetyltransferase [Armatimonadota bacterium]